MGLETKSVPFFRFKMSTFLVFFHFFGGLILARNNRESRDTFMSPGRTDTRGLRHEASQNKLVQNAFPIFECQMERRHKIQCMSFYYKKLCMGPFILFEFSTKQRILIKQACTLLVKKWEGRYFSALQGS